MAESKTEQIKEQSRYLRGTIAETLRSDASHFGEEEIQLLKFHGTYQQDDRDARVELKRAGLDKAWSFMVRTKIPGGHLAAADYLKPLLKLTWKSLWPAARMAKSSARIGVEPISQARAPCRNNFILNWPSGPPAWPHPARTGASNEANFLPVFVRG